MTTDLPPDNPFAAPWQTAFATVPFSRIKAEHFMPAFRAAMAAEDAEIAAIANNPDPASFANTLEALEQTGQMLKLVSSSFHLLSGTCSTDELQTIDEEVSPLLSRHATAIGQNEKLFARIDTVYNQRSNLTPEQARLAEEYHYTYRLAGVGLPPADKERIATINARLSESATEFSNRLLNEAKAKCFVVDSEADLAGLPEAVKAAAAETAAKRGHKGKYAFTLSRPEVETFLTSSERRDLREKLYTAFKQRGNANDAFDTKALIPEAIELRQERARILGYKNHADMVTSHNMAKSPAAALGLLTDLWEPACRRFEEEKKELQAEASAHGQNDPVQPWDWYFYADRVRQKKYDLDDSVLRPYLELESVREAAFATASQLFGISFNLRPEIEAHHPEARTWEVLDRNGQHLGLFTGDYFARDSKRAGAWMDELRGQNALSGQRPHVYNVCNFAKPAESQPALLSLDDALTVFHEFGHGLHGLLSQVEYPSLSGTNVRWDFVELPSQLFEHWLTAPAVMKKYLRHAKTGAEIPDDLIAKIKKSQTFNKGFETVRYLSSALLDMELHLLPSAKELDVNAFETTILKKYALPEGAEVMHHLPHFKHSAEGGYSAQYYVYIWAGVLEHDAFAAFEESGNPFDAATAHRLLENIYSAGNRRDPAETYRLFRGRDATRDALLRNRGLVAG